MSTQTVLFDPPVRQSNLEKPIVKYLFTIQNLHPLTTVDTTTGNMVIALPPAGVDAAGQSNQNQELTFRKSSPDANTVTIKGSIDGPQILTTNVVGPGSWVRFKSDGANWWVTG